MRANRQSPTSCAERLRQAAEMCSRTAKRCGTTRASTTKLSGEKIQLVPQQPLLALDPMQRAGNAVKEALVATKHAKRGNDVKQKALRLFDIVGLERTLWGRLPLHLSGGQAQRLVIARALATEPTLLISDESTSMLDPSTSQSILDLYDRLVDTLGISVLFISHDVQW